MTGLGRMTRSGRRQRRHSGDRENRLRLADRRELSAAARRRRARGEGLAQRAPAYFVWRISRLTEFPRKSPKRHRLPSPPQD